MNPETQLAIMMTFTGFLLKTSLGFCICWGISKVLVSPRGRFLVWFAFLVGAGFYALWLVASLGLHQPAFASVTFPAEVAPLARVGKFRIQASLAYSVSILLRTLGALYLIVLGRFLFARIRKQFQLRWVLRFSYQAPPAIEELFRLIAESLKVGQVQLLMLEGIHSPATFGWMRPTILLPPICLEQDEGELRDIFRHEFQHVRRRDFVFSTVASFCRALLFFHPAVWYAKRRLELESELACDLAVISQSPERRATYAECLVRFARLNSGQQPTPWNLDFAGSSIQLKVRVRSMLAETREIPAWLMGLRVALGLLLLAGFVAIVPSLFVGLSYEQVRIAPLAESASVPSPSQVRLRRSGVLKASLQRQATDPSRDSAALSAEAPGSGSSAPDADAAPVVRREPAPTLSGRPQPTLKRRGDTTGVAAQKTTQGTTILLQNEPSSPSADADARRASAISDIAAGVSQAVSVASHGRDRDGH
jgi:beta-lactamase regulating signal transducer with metallopeptidase domain